MKAPSVASFTKTVACPSSRILLSFRLNALSPEIRTLVKHHLASCEFCGAEIPLLSHYQEPSREDSKAPEIPINLRILAESLLGRRQKPPRRAETKGLKFGLSLTDG